MTERVINRDGLQTYLETLIPTRQVRVRETDKGITLEPVEDKSYRSPLRGLAADSGFTVDKYLQSKQEEKELEREQDLRL